MGLELAARWRLSSLGLGLGFRFACEGVAVA